MKQRIVKTGKVYRHFKGKYYLVLFVATDAMTDVEVVVYQQLTTGRIFTRPMDVLMSPVDTVKYPDAKQYWRFEELDCKLNEQ